jgi:hypothetical protein
LGFWEGVEMRLSAEGPVALAARVEPFSNRNSGGGDPAGELGDGRRLVDDGANGRRDAARLQVGQRLFAVLQPA